MMRYLIIYDREAVLWCNKYIALDSSFPVTGRPLSLTEFLNEFLNEIKPQLLTHKVNCLAVTTLIFFPLSPWLFAPKFKLLESRTPDNLNLQVIVICQRRLKL